ncbi:translocation protein, partial [Planoprotostelium fungivorum]
MAKNNYDDSASIFFAISILGIILIATTIAYIKTWKRAFSKAYKGECNCDACHTKAEATQLENRKPTKWAIFKFGLYLLVWAVFLYLTINAYQKSSQEPVLFDPYKILELDQGATDAEIKSSYRKLSLKNHPDKNPSADAAARYTEIAKAYTTLTDPDTKEKWEKYGNPDGPQGFTMGVALPGWLVDGKNKSVVLAIYVIFLVIVFPTVAICFWTSQKDKAHNQLNNKTMGYFYQNVKQGHRFRYLIDIWCLSFEYVQEIPVRRSDEAELMALKDKLPSDEKRDQQVRKSLKANSNNNGALTHPLRIKNPMLLFSHLSRYHYTLSPLLRKDLDVFLKKAHQHIFGLVEISAAQQWLIPTLENIYTAQMITQAVWGDSARMGKVTDLLQIPHFTEATMRKAADKPYKVNDITSFFALPKEKRDAFLTENFSPEQRADIEKISGTFPHDVSISSVESFNEDDDDEGAREKKVTANSLVTLVATIHRPSLNPADDKSKDLAPEVHAPFYPLPKREAWWLILADDRTSILISFKKVPALCHNTEVKLQFQAPRKMGVYNWTLYLVTDSFVGFDVQKSYKLEVEKEAAYVPPPKEEEEEDEAESGEESESDTDIFERQLRFVRTEHQQPAYVNKGEKGKLHHAGLALDITKETMRRSNMKVDRNTIYVCAGIITMVGIIEFFTSIFRDQVLVVSSLLLILTGSIGLYAAYTDKPSFARL